MKNNDFDFIKDKIDRSGVNAPAEMDEAFVLSKLDKVQPDPTPVLTEVKPKKHHYALISGIAAAFVAVVALTVVGAILIAQRITPVTESDLSIGGGVALKTFSSYDEVKAKAKEIETSYSAGYRKYDLWTSDGAVDKNYESNEAGGRPGSSGSSSDSSSGGSSGGAGSDSYSETYKQVEGVDEADIVKTDGKYIYVAPQYYRPDIDIYTATEKPERVTMFFPGNFDDPMKMADDDAHSLGVLELYLYNGKLIVVGEISTEDYSCDTMAAVYDVSDVGSIKLVNTFRQSGYYSTSRMIGDDLYLVSEHSVESDDFEIPVCYSGEDAKEIPIENVCCVENPSQPEMLIVGGYSLTDSSQDAQSAAILGAVEDVYCNAANMYIYATDWNVKYIVDYGVYDDLELPDGGVSSRYVPKDYEPVTTDIYKVSLKDGISFTASAKVKGSLDSRYSLDEKDGYLRVASTVEDAFGNQSNCLYVLDGDLKEVGSITGFARDESIKAVRYVGDVAYVITYEQTDPLFVIDLSVPTNPAILGEVKIDGFSTMLIPVDENTILGVGVYTEDVDYTDMQVQNGVKLALFDVSDKLHPKVLDERSYREYESEAVCEPRAFVYNPDRGDYLIPLNRYEYAVDKYGEYMDTVVHAGALNFKIEGGRIVEIDRPEANTDSGYESRITRCAYVGDYIYMISSENDDYDKMVIAAKHK